MYRKQSSLMLAALLVAGVTHAQEGMHAQGQRLPSSGSGEFEPFGLSGTSVIALAAYGGAVYAGTGGDGVWRYERHRPEISSDAITLTLRLQESIRLDTTLALEIDTALEAARSQYDTLRSIHAFPDYVPTHLSVKSDASWTDVWRTDDLWTGNEEVDSLGREYGLVAVRHSWGDWFLLEFTQPMKMPLLATLYDAVEGVVHAEPNGYVGDGSNIEGFKKNDVWHFAFSLGMGDCPAGCMFRYYWYVTVDQSFSVRLVDERERGYEAPYIYLWNIPPRYAATVFSGVDHLFSAAKDASEWWVRRHAVEVIGLLFEYDYPWVGEDDRNRVLFDALRWGVHQHRDDVLVLLRGLLNDPDEDVQASVRRVFNRVLDLEGGDLAFYFPLRIGNRWTFSQLELGTSWVSPESLTETIIDTVNMSDGIYHVFDMYRFISDARLRITNDGTVLLSQNASKQIWVDFSATVADSWVVSDRAGTPEWTVFLESTTDSVTVPAGTFPHCYRFLFRFDGCDNSWDEWYAPGVGPVKRIHYGVAVMEYALLSASVNGMEYPTRVEGEPDASAPGRFRLSTNYPNPFNTSTCIHYDLPAQTFVTLAIYNLLGQKVRTLVNESQKAGSHHAVWDGRDDATADVPSGVYLYRFIAGSIMTAKKLILVR